MPRRPNSIANIKPHGPAPMMITAKSRFPVSGADSMIE
jgi:hypothetical protein